MGTLIERVRTLRDKAEAHADMNAYSVAYLVAELAAIVKEHILGEIPQGQQGVQGRYAQAVQSNELEA
jgi:hypothetical protein